MLAQFVISSRQAGSRLEQVPSARSISSGCLGGVVDGRAMIAVTLVLDEIAMAFLLTAMGAMMTALALGRRCSFTRAGARSLTQVELLLA